MMRRETPTPRVPTEIVSFSEPLLTAVARFSEAAWQRPRGPRYLRWRYLEAPFHRALLAMNDGRCLAMLSTFLRPYRADDEVVHVADSFDWYTLPELRRSGLGVRLMQRLQKGPDPVIVTGGTADTRDLLPRMGFRSLAEVRRYALPMGVERTAAALARRGVPHWAGAAAFRTIQPFFAPRRRAAPRGARVLAAASVGPEALAIDPRPGGRGCAPVWTEDLLRWLGAGFPGIGHFVPLYFAVGTALVGWALVRIQTSGGECNASLLDVRCREAEDEDLYTWMVSEAALRASGFAPGLLTAATTSPVVEAALRRNRFRFSDTAPIHFGSEQRKGLGEPVVFGAHWGDEPLVPYPTEWWEAD
jgi:hypothetical protein